MRRVSAAVAFVVSLAFVAGCRTLPFQRAAESHWLVPIDGDVEAALRIFERAAADFGAKSLGDPTRYGATYRLYDITFGVWPTDKGLAIVAGPIEPGLNVDVEIPAALESIATLATRTSKTSFRLQRQTALDTNIIATHPAATPAKVIPGYDKYLESVFAKVNARFDAIIEDSRDYPYIGSFVRVTFVLTADGHVSRIVNVETHGSDLPAKLAVRALTESAPFGNWPATRVAALGTEENELTFTFVYE